MANNLEHSRRNKPHTPGVFITFEGGDGVGKTTHLRNLAEVLKSQGLEVLCLREPGGTQISEQLRSIVLNSSNSEMCAESELFTFEAARAQLVSEVIMPALRRGAIVLCDRFIDSTVVYQGFGRGLDVSFIKQANNIACQGLLPHRTLLLVAGGAEVGLKRASELSCPDRMERAGINFHSRVVQGFLQLASENESRIRVVQSGGETSKTALAILSELTDIFPWLETFMREHEREFCHLDATRTHEGRIHLNAYGSETHN